MQVTRLQRILDSMHILPRIEAERQELYRQLKLLKRKQRALLEQHKELSEDLSSLEWIVQDLRQKRDMLNIAVQEKKTLANTTRNSWDRQRYKLEVNALSKEANETHQQWNELKTARSTKKHIDREIWKKLQLISTRWVEITSRLDELAEELWDTQFLANRAQKTKRN